MLVQRLKSKLVRSINWTSEIWTILFGFRTFQKRNDFAAELLWALSEIQTSLDFSIPLYFF